MGDPGIGKSTLLLQLTCKLAGLVIRQRIFQEGSRRSGSYARPASGLAKADVELGTATKASDIVASMDGPDKPTLWSLTDSDHVFA